MAWDFSRVFTIPPGGFILKEVLDAVFHPTTGHSHDGVDSVALAGGAADNTSLALSGGVFSVKAKGVTEAKLADAVTAKLNQVAANVACASDADAAAVRTALIATLAALKASGQMTAD